MTPVVLATLLFLSLQHVSGTEAPANPTLVTFITPCKGRPTVSQTLLSLLSQTDPRWQSIVVLDGWWSDVLDYGNSTHLPVMQTLLHFKADPRIRILALPRKIGKDLNHAGLVRNEAFLRAATPWVAFVDDDDELSVEYVRMLTDLVGKFPNASVIIFRMSLNGQILPIRTATNFWKCGVGISFAMRTELCTAQDLCFQPGQYEDFDLLDRIRSAGHQLVIAPQVAYFVKGSRPVHEALPVEPVVIQEQPGQGPVTIFQHMSNRLHDAFRGRRRQRRPALQSG